MALDPNSEVKLTPGQKVQLREGTVVKLDPNSSVRVIGELKIPQPSKYQLQPEAKSATDELPFTSYVIFKNVKFGAGMVETGWSYDLTDTTRPQLQHCYYRQAIAEGLAGKITLALNGSPKAPSPLAKLPFKFEEALGNCVWFSGY